MSERTDACCFCKTPIEIEYSTMPPTWFGRYDSTSKGNSKFPVAVACLNCLQDPVNKEKWETFQKLP